MGVDVCRFVGFPNNRCEGVTLTSSNCTALMIGERERESLDNVKMDDYTFQGGIFFFFNQTL